jgi:hypothetical protein
MSSEKEFATIVANSDDDRLLLEEKFHFVMKKVLRKGLPC